MKKRLVRNLSSVLLALFLTSLAPRSFSETFSSTKPTNPDKFYQVMDDNHMNKKLEDLCHEMYKTPDKYTRYFDKTEYVPLNTNWFLPKDYVKLTTRVSYTKEKLRLFVGVDDQKIKDSYKIRNIFFWLVSTSKETNSTQYALTLDRKGKTAEILKTGDEICRGAYCEEVLDNADKILDATLKKVGLPGGNKDLKILLYLADIRMASRVRAENLSRRLQDQGKGRTYVSSFMNTSLPFEMFRDPEVKAYEILMDISGSEPYGLVVLTYGAKVTKSGNDLNSEPCLNVIHFNFNLRE